MSLFCRWRRLQGCSNSSSAKTEGTTYSYVFVEDPTTLDYTVSGRHGTSQITTQGVDGLLENDRYGNLIPSLAKDWKVSSDGLTYTYTLRKGVKWYTSDGEEYAEVTADDFVAGLKHAADKKSSTLYIVQDSIKGLNDYVEGTTKEFSKVGIKAIDKYTLNQPESYWNSKTTYYVSFNLNRKAVVRE
ncbi:extracellular solute-binding protein, family 5 Middle [Streptococcus gallolyticus]|uniref:Extracellular solute-binding protein, family 5 Middle n=1 Tax=Streptococcus gallolyticus TaxID=315405 RepID=A0A1H9LJT9_9STRE|nr:extracellular solute-binding protein, family 5 Middle [Streptococcus gallolyticus]